MDPAHMLHDVAPLPAAHVTFDLKAVHQAFDTGLECWWQIWQQSPRYTLRVYAAVFKCRRHMDKDTNYMLANSVSARHKRQLLLFRCFNTKLNKHVAKWEHGSGNQRSHERAVCRLCSIGEVEDESHVLHDCPAYQHLRGRYRIPMVPQPYRFLPCNAHQVAGFLRAALHLRDHPPDLGQQLGAAGEEAIGAGDNRGAPYRAAWWIFGMGVWLAIQSVGSWLGWFLLGVAILTLVRLAIT
jgi:hypothetical protein